MSVFRPDPEASPLLFWPPLGRGGGEQASGPSGWDGCPISDEAPRGPQQVAGKSPPPPELAESQP